VYFTAKNKLQSLQNALGAVAALRIVEHTSSNAVGVPLVVIDAADYLKQMFLPKESVQ